MRSPISFLPLACLALLLAGAGMAPLMAQGLGDSTAAAPVTADPKPDTQNFLPPKLATAGTGVTSPKLDSISARVPNSAGCTPINPCATVTPALDGLGPVKAANGEEPAANGKSGGANRPARAAKGGAAKPQDAANAAPGGMRSGMGRPCMRGGNFAGGGGGFGGGNFGGGGFRPGAGAPVDPNDPEAAARRARFIAAFRARMAAANADPDHKPVGGPGGLPCGGMNRQADGAPGGAPGGFRRGAAGAQTAAPVAAPAQ